MKNMHESAFACHTYDRDNMVAQVDCNNEFSSVFTASERLFKMKHWPYMHEDSEDENSVTYCIKRISMNYLPNLLAIAAIQKVIFSFFGTILSVTAIYSL